MIQDSSKLKKNQLKERIISFFPLYIVPKLAFALIWVWMRTLRWQVVFGSKQETVSSPDACILVFWHGEQLMMPRIVPLLNGVRKRRICALISQHSDGRMIAGAIRGFGIESVAGSSSRGGVAALKALHKELKKGSVIAITPDGPRGPKHEIKPGVVSLAQLSGARVFPLSIKYRSSRSLRSWDEFILPRPFSKAVLAIGESFSLGRDEELEESRIRIFKALETTSKKADLAL